MKSIKIHDQSYEKNFLKFQKSEDINICVTTYEVFKQRKRLFQKQYWAAIVYDEGI